MDSKTVMPAFSAHTRKTIPRWLAKVQTWLALLILASVGLLLIRFLWRQVFPPADISLAPFTVSGSNLKTNGEAPPKVLGAKLQNLKNVSETAPTGYGFLKIPLLSIPEELDPRQKETGKRFEDLNLKIKDVDVNAVVRTIQAILSPSPVELHGQITELADSVEITCQLVKGSSVIAAWRSARKKDSPFNEETAVDRLLDDILFQLLYDIPRRESLKRWRTSGDVDDFPNWQALQAFMQGLRNLRLYQQDLDYAALERAQDYLQRLQMSAPNHALGLYFYGVSLAEDRKETEAAEVFEQVRLLPDAGEAVKFHARLQEAGARLRHYQPADALTAADLLRSLIGELNRKIAGAQTGSAARDYYTKLVALAHAQLGYTEGTLISLTGDASHDAAAKGEFQAAEQSLRDAKWQADEKADAEFRIRNARGYTMFRFAQATERDDAAFHEKCDAAIAELQAARRLRPNHYEVLQNLALIYDNERYDRTLASLDTAESLYKQTVRFVPKDYYQYERLTRVVWRRMREAPLPEQRSALAEEGKKWARLALDYRRQSREGGLMLARFCAESFRTAQGDLAARLPLARQASDALDSALALPLRKHQLPVLEELAAFFKELALTTGVPEHDLSVFKRRQQALKDKIAGVNQP